jgi:hypothetical protein
MHSAGTCPHCATSIHALGVLRVNRRTPYRCAVCGGKSIIPPSNGLHVMFGWTVAVGLSGVVLEYLQAGRIALFILCLVSAGMLPLVLARFCWFERQDRAAR